MHKATEENERCGLWLHNYFWRSWNSSCQAIWMASSLDSLEAAGSPVKRGSSVIHLCMSVKRTVRGSVSGYLSVSAMAMSSRSSQSKVGGIFDFPRSEIFISGDGIS